MKQEENAVRYRVRESLHITDDTYHGLRRIMIPRGKMIIAKGEFGYVDGLKFPLSVLGTRMKDLEVIA